MLNIMVSSLVERQAVEPEGALGCEVRVTQLKIRKYKDDKCENETIIETITKGQIKIREPTGHTNEKTK